MTFLRTCVFAALSLLMVGTARSAISVDATAFGNQGTARTTLSTSSFSTTASNELLLAFVSADQVSSAATTVTGITGGALTWVLVKRTNTQLGTAEIWRAFASSTLSSVTVTATLSQSVCSSITVMSFAGADTSGTNGSGAIGAVGTGNGNPGSPTASLITTRNGSLVVGVGNDFDNAIARSVGPGQSLVHQYFPPVGDTYWVQMETSATPLSGTTVTINDTAPSGDRYNLSTAEILAAGGGTGSAFTVSGTISPATAGTGTTVTLAQGTTTIATSSATGSGTFSFSNIANGTYTVTPSNSAFTFSPASQSVTVSGTNSTAPVFNASAPTFTVSGTISPATAGAGTTVTLSQGTKTVATTSATSGGTYSFTNVTNGTYTVTPSKAGFTFGPTNQTVQVNGSNQSSINFTAQGTQPALLLPDMQVIVPTDKMSIVRTSSGSRQFQYTHDIFNAGPGPLVIQPIFNPATGNYQGSQQLYSLSSSGVWSLSETQPIAGTFYFDADHVHWHFPYASYGLYTVAADGGVGSPIAVSVKVGFCIDDSFLYDPSLPNAGAIGNLGTCSDPTTLRGLDIGAVDEYDQTDPGQSIVIDGLPDGTYWFRTVVDPNNFLAEADKTNNETDVEVTITGSTVQVLKTVVPALNSPPNISISSPSNGATVSGIVQLTANTATTSGVQYLVDGQAFGGLVSASPYSLSWDSRTVSNGTHWLAAQTKDPTGIIGSSPVAIVTVNNAAASGPVVQLASPANGSILSATVSLWAQVGSSFPITGVSFFVDFAQIGSPLTTAPYIMTWDTTTVPDGQHTITVSATDSQGNVGNSAPVTLSVDNSHPANLIGKEVTVSADGHDAITTALFSTATPSDLLVAFVSYDGPSNGPQTASVTGGGLTWTLLERSNTEAGTAEIWAARADGILSNVAVSSFPQSGSGYHGSLTVIAFTNAAGTSVVGRTGAPTGAPDIPLPGVIAGDWVFAVGNDWDSAIARVPISGQVLVHQKVDTAVGDTYWVQSTTAPSSANAVVEIHDNSPTTDRWNYAAVEIVATHQ